MERYHQVPVVYTEDLHISHCLYWVILMCQYFHLFVLQVICFMGLFSCKNCTSVHYSVGAYLFFPMPF